MKKLLILFVFFGSIYTHGQNDKNITTIEEYNYLVNGYEKDLENGRSIKEGYELKPIADLKGDPFRIQYLNFYSSTEEKSKAVLIIITKNNNKTKYLCLPYNNGPLLKRFSKDYEGLGISMQMSFDASMFLALQDLFEYKLNIKN